MKEDQWLTLEQLTGSLSSSIAKAGEAIAAHKGKICYLPRTFRVTLPVRLRYKDGETGLELSFPELGRLPGSASGEVLSGDAGGGAPLASLTLTFHSNIVAAEAAE